MKNLKPLYQFNKHRRSLMAVVTMLCVFCLMSARANAGLFGWVPIVGHHIDNAIQTTVSFANKAVEGTFNFVNQATAQVGVDSTTITDTALENYQTIRNIMLNGGVDIDAEYAKVQNLVTAFQDFDDHQNKVEKVIALADGLYNKNPEVAFEAARYIIQNVPDVNGVSFEAMANQLKNAGAQSLLLVVSFPAGSGKTEGAGLAVRIDAINAIRNNTAYNEHSMSLFTLAGLNISTSKAKPTIFVGYHKTRPENITGNAVTIGGSKNGVKLVLGFKVPDNALDVFPGLNDNHKGTLASTAPGTSVQIGGSSRKLLFTHCNGRIQQKGQDCSVHQTLASQMVEANYPTDHIASINDTVFVWKSYGTVPNMHCVHINEPSDNAGTWNDNYLCTSHNIGIEWSHNGPINNKHCTQITEPNEPANTSWNNNYLCLPVDSEFSFSWSNNGSAGLKNSVRWRETADTNGWSDNYLGVHVVNQLGNLKGQFNGRCLEAHYPNNHNVQAFNCHGGSNQQWVLTHSGQIHTKHSNRCLDAAGPHGNLYMHTCHGGNNQKWDLMADGTIRDRAYGQCADLHAFNNTNGANVQMYPCNSFSNQRWDNGQLGFGLHRDLGQLKSFFNSRCLEVDGSNNVIVHDCNQGAQQKWKLTSDGQIRSDSNNLCLDAASSYGNLYMHTCHNGNNQRWDLTDSGEIRDRHYNQCIDLYAFNQANGANVQMYHCNTANNQKWLITKS